MKNIRFFIGLTMLSLSLAGMNGCAAKKPKDPKQTYLDEVKYTQKGGTSYLGLFTTQPVKSFYADKLANPPSIVVNLESINVEEAKLPKSIKENAIQNIHVKSVILDEKKYGQVNIFLAKDADFSIKQTEYGLRLDIKPVAVAQSESPKIEVPPTPSETIVEAPKTTTPENDIEKDLEELDKAQAETAVEPQKSGSQRILEKIDRASFDHKERLTLIASEPMEYQTSVLDRQMTILLKQTKPSEIIAPVSIDEEESYLTSVNAKFSEAPYPNTKITLSFNDAIIPIVTQNENLIYVDFLKPKLAKVLQESETVLDYGNYLTSPSRLPGRTISIQAKDTDLQDIFRLLSEASDYNIIASKDISGKISTRLVKVPWDEAFISILQAHQLGFVKQGNILRVSTLTSLKEEKEKAVQALEAKEFLHPLQIMFIPVNHRKASEMVRHVYPVLSSRGSLSIDRVTNTIIMRDTSGALEQAKKLVSSLDVKK